MKIAFHLWALKDKKRREGIGWLITYTLRILIEKHPNDTFILLVTKDFDASEFTAPNVEVHHFFHNKRHPVLYLLYLHYLLPRLMKKLKPDLLVCADGMSMLHPNVPELTMIHDIHFFHHPETAKWRNRWYYNRYFPKYAKTATRIATISEYSKHDIATNYHVPESKIDNIYCGLNGNFLHPLPKPEPFRFQHIIDGPPYFYFIGSLNPRKNVDRLIAAFGQFKKGGYDAKLVIAGASGWLTDAINAALAASNYKEDILFTGRLADDEVKPMMEHALALSFVPYYEGFGLPLLEAMVCHTPIITSNVTSLPEVAGDAALIVDPFNVQSITNALIKVYTDATLRKELVEKGNKRYPLFTWERTAELLWESIERTVLEAKGKKK